MKGGPLAKANREPAAVGRTLPKSTRGAAKIAAGGDFDVVPTRTSGGQWFADPPASEVS